MYHTRAEEHRYTRESYPRIPVRDAEAAAVHGISRGRNEDTSSVLARNDPSEQKEENEIGQTGEAEFTMFRELPALDDPRYVCRRESVNHALARSVYPLRLAFSEPARAEERRIYNPNKITRRDFRGQEDSQALGARLACRGSEFSDDEDSPPRRRQRGGPRRLVETSM